MFTFIDPEDLPFVQTGVPDLLVTAPQEVGLMLRLEEEDELQVLDQLEQAIRPFRDANVKVKTLLRIGTPWNEIVRAADD